MSAFQFVASDKPLNEIINSKFKSYSINDALNLGIELDMTMLDDIDRDDKSAIILCNDEYDLEELTITNDLYYSIDVAAHYTNKNYISRLNWNYSEERAMQLINYIKKHLKTADEIELWDTWLGDKQAAKTIVKNVNDLTVNDIKVMFDKVSFKAPQCLIVKNDLKEKI